MSDEREKKQGNLESDTEGTENDVEAHKKWGRLASGEAPAEDQAGDDDVTAHVKGGRHE